MKNDPENTPETEDEPTPKLLDGNNGTVLRLLDASACFFIERTTGHIDVVAKDRASNLFRRNGYDINYYDRGADQPPADPRSYVMIGELEAMVEDINDEDREASAQAMNEERTDRVKTRHYSELAPVPDSVKAPDPIVPPAAEEQSQPALTETQPPPQGEPGQTGEQN